MSTPIRLKANYTNPDIHLLYNSSIIEYDMRDAGFNIIKRFNLLPVEKIAYLEKLSKKERNISIGKLRGVNYDLSRGMAVNLRNTMSDFIVQNNISDADIVSIKNDAVFVYDKKVDIVSINDIEFATKNIYTSYALLNRIEFYYSDTVMDIKGFGPELQKFQDKFMISYFKRMLRMKETTSMDVILRECTSFNNKYLALQLPKEYYFELTSLGGYKLKNTLTSQDVFLDQISDDMIQDIDTSYNYINFILPFTRLLLQ